MTDHPPNVYPVAWTAKMVGLRAVTKARKYSYLMGLALFIIGVVFVGYSTTIKEWCVPRQNVPAVLAFSTDFHVSLHGCLRNKGWLEF